ncbi:MAG: hypothetical protein SD837_14315 [Candidatus Electrothrix scaldis]|nr:MAG: hypothetical protein SD837_14315 [Candidatus Electrothrix sp. GW3-3]
MHKQKNREQDIQALQERRELVSAKLDRIETQKILETRAEEKFRLEQSVQEVRAERDAIDQELERLIGDLQQSASLSGKYQLSRLPRTDARLFGREEELKLLDQAWQDEATNVLVLTAFGGMGKTALMQAWLDAKGYAGADAVYTWSFYSQGTAEDRQASAAEFFASALPWFGHDGSPLPSEHDRGLRLAELVCRQRTLLILDGLEPLQYPLAGAMEGALRDKGLLCLCRQLAAQNNGLLLISSRQPVQELVGRPGAEQHELEPLSGAAGLALFRAAGIRGREDELAAAVAAYHGHALSLSLLATYLRVYEDGDIRRQDGLRCLTEFPEETRTSRHAFRVMAAYERQLAGSTDLQVLYSLGLFDRPVSAGAMACLRQSGIAEVGGPEDDRIFQAACKRLRRLGLLNREEADHPGTLDCHPLVRQYFGVRLEELHPASWQQAHARLYEYFKALPEKELPDTLEEMEPLFAAVRHGCAAGLHQQALHEVYWPRIRHSNDNYLCRNLGAFAADLSVLAHFFAHPWHTPAPSLSDEDKAVVLNWAAFRLRALGRLAEAAEPMQASRDILIQQENWKSAAAAASNLSELLLTIGKVAEAVAAGQQSVELADRSGDAFERLIDRTTLADALHQAGEQDEARALFVQAEQLQQEWQPEYDRLYSLRGFQYCDLLLGLGQWQEACERATQTLEWDTPFGRLLDIGLHNLSLGRAAMQETLAQADLPAAAGLAPDLACLALPASAGAATSRAGESLHRAKDRLDQAMTGLREAGHEEFIARGLLARAAWCRWAIVLLRQADALTQAVQDLQECEEIARRGGMKLFLIDFHLEAARLALTAGRDILGRSPAEHLAAARKGIDETGYKRRLPEVANIEEALEG